MGVESLESKVASIREKEAKDLTQRALREERRGHGDALARLQTHRWARKGVESRWKVGCSWKLFQEADVVLEKDLEVVDAVFEHRQAVHAHAEGEAVHFFGVVVDEAVDGRVDHTGSKKFDPAGAF